MTRAIDTIHGIRSYVSGCRKKGMSIGFVPTMGAFHEGHLSLMRAARKTNDSVIVSIFVNPIQFAAGEDYDRYPRRPDQDAKMAAAESVDILFIPSVAEMYPKGFDSFVDQSDLPAKMCGQFRPGHFRGVQTIVCKLFNIVRPDTVYFGQKDYQQALIIRRMATDLNQGVRARILPTVREEDEVAMSSRNIYLGPKQRKDATCLIRALRRAEDMVGAGASSAPKVIAEMKRLIHRVKGTKIEYISIVNADTLEPVKEIKGRTLVALAVRVGKVRLIDNLLL